MTRSAITVTSGDTLKRAMTLMTNHRVRHLIVIGNGQLVGIVSIGDVVKYRLEDLEAEIECPAGRLCSSTLTDGSAIMSIGSL
jgi:CBS domain-containing protein